MSVIETKNLTKDYGHGRGVFDVSFSVDKGEVFGFLGPNGAGKSTTIRHIMGFSKPQSGQCLVFGKQSFDRYYEILANVGYIPGEIALPQGLSGWQFIRMMQSLQGKRDDKHLAKMLDLFKLDDAVLKGETKRMSLGVKRKLAIVVAFMHDPDVYILDEPTSGLDPVMQQVFVDYIKSEKERGKTILLSSHIFSEVDETCDRIAIIKHGKIVSNFNANDLKHSATKFYNITFENLNEFNAFVSEIKTNANISVLKQQKKLRSLLVKIDQAFTNELVNNLSKYKIKNFASKIITLEEYFMKFYKDDLKFGGK